MTLLEGTAFCVCGPSGDVVPGGTEGIFFRDTRLASRWELLVDSHHVEPLAVIGVQPFCATFAGRTRPRPGRAESTVLVSRTRYVGGGMREDITVRNFADETVALHISLRVESDLADIFDVKAGRHGTSYPTIDTDADGLVFSTREHDRVRGARISAEAATVSAGGLSFVVIVAPRATWRTTVLLQPRIDGQELPPRFPVDQPIAEAGPSRRLEAWRRSSPRAASSNTGLGRALYRSRDDLGSLRLFNPDDPTLPPSVAAGAPWFMTLFGRDALLASSMALPLDPSLALGTVSALAHFQGERVDPLSEEEPGKIIHELRHGSSVSGVVGGAHRAAYYGSVDATPLFVMLLGQLRRWGVLGREELKELLPAADRALAWVEQYGDLDGDGFVEYLRKTDRGLLNQGWKDSHDGINFADGTLARPPIALAEVQGYVYAAYLARAHMAGEMGDTGTAERYTERAAALKQAFNEVFWLPDRGWFAVGLDHDKKPIDALASNMGHCLLTGIIDDDKADAVASRLTSPEMFSGWGIRTLASSMGAYNPMSYHNGSVWPHDNALIAGGLMRYGFVEQAQQVAMAVLQAAEAFGGRLPELFCGFGRDEYRQPVPYPTSCSPQAWAAAAPVYLMRVLLRLDPCLPCGKVWLAPALPPELGEVRIERLPVGGQRVSLRARGKDIDVNGFPEDMELIQAPASRDYAM
ncbi:MAG TPA: glycogen debranching N-terminal domain-containing protein [Trebonia sp.]|nr:glycogen debranching N-terminal domain-containing protein [Trebonia sp.]